MASRLLPTIRQIMEVGRYSPMPGMGVTLPDIVNCTAWTAPYPVVA